MEHPLVGGYTADKVALRRAVALGFDGSAYIRSIFSGYGVQACAPFVPATFGYDPAYRTAMAEYDPARAKALLDTYGYVDRDGDGWRELPDGAPLALEIAASDTQRDRSANELWKKYMTALGLQHVISHRPVARTRQAVDGRAADDVGLCVAGGPARQRHDLRHGVRAESRVDQRCTLRPAGLQPAVRAAARAARWTRATGDVARRLAPAGRLHAVHDAHASGVRRSCAAVGGRIPPSSVQSRKWAWIDIDTELKLARA